MPTGWKDLNLSTVLFVKVFASSLKKSVLMPVLTRELVPETRSRNTLLGKYPNQYAREGHDEGAG